MCLEPSDLIGETLFNPKKPSDIKNFRAIAKECESRLEVSMSRGPVATHSGSCEIVHNIKETGSAMIDFMTTFTSGRFQSYLFRDFSIAAIKMEISPFMFEYDH